MVYNEKDISKDVFKMWFWSGYTCPVNEALYCDQFSLVFMLWMFDGLQLLWNVKFHVAYWDQSTWIIVSISQVKTASKMT